LCKRNPQIVAAVEAVLAVARRLYDLSDVGGGDKHSTAADACSGDSVGALTVVGTLADVGTLPFLPQEMWYVILGMLQTHQLGKQAL
jgi:hypothetical protein